MEKKVERHNFEVLKPNNLLSSNSLFDNTQDPKAIIRLAIDCIEEYRYPRQAEKHDGINRAISLLYIFKANKVSDSFKMMVLDAFLTKGLTGSYSAIERSDLVKMLRTLFSHPTVRTFIQIHAAQNPGIEIPLKEAQKIVAESLTTASKLELLKLGEINDYDVLPYSDRVSNTYLNWRA